MKTNHNTKSNTVKIFGIAILILAFAPIAEASGNGSKPNASPKIKLNFIITNSGNATVELWNKKTSLIEAFQTDANGKVSITMKPKTNYEVFIKKQGFELSQFKMFVDDITESADYTEIIKLKKSGNLSAYSKN